MIPKLMNEKIRVSNRDTFAGNTLPAEDWAFINDTIKMFDNEEGVIDDYFALPFDFSINPLTDTSILGKGAKGVIK